MRVASPGSITSPNARRSLRTIVAAVGGDIYAGGRRANIPAPGHSSADRSVSLWLSEGRVIVHCFGDSDWRAVLQDLRSRGLVDASGAPRGGGHLEAARPEPLSARARRDAALALWMQAGPIRPQSAAAAYVRGRAVRRDVGVIEALRSHAAVPLSVYQPGRAARPALLAAVCDAGGNLTALEITYLEGGGLRANRVRVPRKTVGVLPPGSAVRLDPPAAELLVAEGVFTALSAADRFGLPAWALLSTSNLRRWRPPDGVRRVLIASDRDRDGEASAARLAAALAALGVAARVALPPAPFGDWNDWATAADDGERSGSPEEGAGGARLGAG